METEFLGQREISVRGALPQQELENEHARETAESLLRSKGEKAAFPGIIAASSQLGFAQKQLGQKGKR